MTGGVSYWVTTTNLFVADNWRYSIVTNNWERIEDTPIDVGNHSISLSNRYILMLGGAIFSSSKMTDRIDISPRDIFRPFRSVKRNKINFIFSQIFLLQFYRHSNGICHVQSVRCIVWQ